MRAREFLAHSGREFELRDLIKQPLSKEEVRTLARRAGGAAALVAPKQRKEAEGMTEAQLVEWLAADGRRLRRPIIDTGRVVTLGFAADAREALEKAL